MFENDGNSVVTTRGKDRRGLLVHVFWALLIRIYTSRCHMRFPRRVAFLRAYLGFFNKFKLSQKVMQFRKRMRKCDVATDSTSE